MYLGQNSYKRNLTKLISLVMIVTWLVQILGIGNIAFGAAPYTFKGYDTENIGSDTFSCQGATKSGSTIQMTDSSEGEAIGFLTFEGGSANIATSIDLGSLEIDFSTVTAVTAEGTEGSENDVPTASIQFCSQADYQDVISTVNLSKPDTTAAGNVTLSSNASIPVGTRSIIIDLKGKNTNKSSGNTVVFSNTSLVIHDAAPPACSVNYNTDWTNQPVTVSVTASDADSGLEGIYKNGTKVSSTSPYTFTASANTSFTVYSKDYAGKSSDTKNISISNIDTTAPSAPSSITLSNNSWTNKDVSVTMPSLGTSTGAPEKYIYSVNGGDWKDVPDDFKFSDTGVYNLSVKTADAAGNISSAVSATAYIDKTAPVINKITQDVSSGSVTVTVDAGDSGGSGMDKMKYAAGSQNADYFASSGSDITGNKFTLSAGGNYTIFVSDKAGNTCIKECGLNTAPVLQDITDKSVDEDTTLNVPVNVSDGETSLGDLKITAVSSDKTLIPSIVINQSGSAVSLDITPGANLHGGPATITVTAEDEQGEKVSDTFDLTVISVNDPPVALDDSGIITDEDKAVAIDVLDNDSDTADGDTLTITDAGTPAHGTAQIADGKIVYTPAANYNGDDSFTYTISDGNGGTASAKVSLSVTEVNDAPVAAADTASTNEDTSVLIDVMGNDTDADIGTTPDEFLTLVSAGNGAHGTVTMENGEVRYTPDPNWNGKDSFTYTIEDRDNVTSLGTVKVTVLGVEDAPWFEGLNSEYTIDEDSVGAPITFSIKDVETPADSLMLQAVSSDENLLKNDKLQITGLADNDDTVTLKLTPEPNQHGDLTISLTLGDGFLTTDASFILHITNVNDPPVAKNDTIYYDEDTECVTIDTNSLISNDTDIDGDILSFAGIAATTTQGTLVAKDETNTVYYYYPKPFYDGTDSFTYSVSDGTVTATGTCKLIANGVNHAPLVTIPDTTYTTDEDKPISNIVFNISDHETAAGDLTVNAASDDTDLISTDGISVVNNGDGTCTLSITPMPDQNGTANIMVTVSDGSLKTSKGFKLVINPEPDSPVAVDDYVYVPVSGIQSFNVLLNDRDPDGDKLSVTSYDASSLSGALTYDPATQLFKYVARTGETGKSTFTYTVTDGTYEDTATVTLDVNTLTHAPSISPIDNRYIYESGSTGGISFTATDVDYGDSITVTATSDNTDLVLNDADHIVLTDNGNGHYSLIVIPVKGAYGYVQITISVTDLQSHTATRSFGLSVYEVNDSPVAVNDDVTTNEDTSVNLNMLANDSDPEGDSLYISNVSFPENGYLSRSGSTYTYTPYSNFNGTDSMTYWVTDGNSTSAATVTIHVTPVNDAPTARDNWATIPNEEGQSVNVSVLSNDYDVDGDTVKTYQIVSQGKYGTASINEDGTVTYMRNETSPEDNGADSFTYSIIDRDTAEGDYLSATATVYIGVVFHSSLYCDPVYESCNEDAAPFIITLPISNPNNVDYTINVGTTSLGTFEVIDNPSGNDTKLRFTPAPDANGSASVSYSLSGTENYTSAIDLYVRPVDDAPVIDSAPASVSCDEDTHAEIGFTYHDVDDMYTGLYLYAYAKNISSGGPIPVEVGISVNRKAESASVTVKPDADTFGSLDIVIGVSDGLIVTERTVHMTINPVDDAPRISPVNISLFEDTDATFAVTDSASDVDGDGQKVTIAQGNGPSHGTAVVNSDGTIIYTPDENWNGTDSLVFTVTDKTSAALSSTQTATLNVISVNDPPVISGLDYYQKTDEDTPKTIGFVVTDPDNDMTGVSSYSITSSNETLAPLSGISISHVSGNDMAITVNPAANAYGKTVIGITASDGELTAHAEFELTVISVNDIPVAQDDTATVNERVGVPAGTTSTTINVAANDSDVEDATLKIVSISKPNAGSVVNNNDGTLTYSVGGDFNGTAAFNYTVMDKNGATDTATVTVTVNPMNDPPDAENDSVTINEDNDITVPVLTNDSDPEGDTLTITGADGCAHGTAVVNGTGVTYTPNENYNGTDGFTYYISDGNGGTASAHVSITIKPVNDPPSIAKHSSNSGDWTMNEDETKSFNFVVSDPETAVENLIIKIASQNESVIKSTNIRLTSVDDYKVITVTPEENQYGVIPVQFKVTDGALTTTEVYDITIAPVNDPPVLIAPARTTAEDTPLNSSVTATDIDSDISALTFSKASDPTHGTVTVNSDGTYTYTPEANWSGTDSFDITVNDGSSENNTDTGTVVITVTPANDPPSAIDDTATTPEDTPASINVLQNDTDADIPYGDALTLKSVGSAAHGTTQIVSGEIEYSPSANWNGSDSFTYTISDKAGKTSSAKVTVTVTPVNDAPSGGDDTASTDEDTPVTIAVTANDDIDLITNPDIEDLKVIYADDPAHGTASISEDGKNIIYTPDPNWNGTEEFNYTSQDKGGLTGTFKVTVTVNPVNDPPVIETALPDVTMNEDGTTTVSFTVSDVEDQASTLTVTATHNNSAMLPSLSVTSGVGGDRSFSITPKPNKNGIATIEVTVKDSQGATSSKTFHLTVNPVNDAPSAQNDSATTDENTAVNIDVLANDDVDLFNEGDTLTITGVSAPVYGKVDVVTVNGREELKYTPTSNNKTKINETENLTYTMQDHTGTNSGAAVTITITPINDPPTISDIADITGIQEDAPNGTGDVSFTVADEEDDDGTLAVTVACSNTALFPLANITVTNPGTGSDRTVKAVPAANMFGTAVITLTVHDAEGLTASDSFTVTVDSVNDIPANGDDNFTVLEDTEMQLNVLANDDPDYATTPEDLSVTAITVAPEDGTVRIADDGKSVYYKPNKDSDLSDSFQYQMFDDKSTDTPSGGYFCFNVTITITPVNDAPVVTLLDGIDTYTVDEGGNVKGIHFSVTDADNNTNCGTSEDTISVKSSNPVLVLGGLKVNDESGVNRDLDVQAYGKWNGRTTITITATDPGGLKGSASFTFIVNSVNEPPVANDDSFTIPEDTTTKVSVLANDTDGDLETNPDTEFIKVSYVVDNDPNAVITVAGDGNGVNIQPKANYNGPVSFTYVTKDASNAESNIATVNVTVSQVNDPPVANDDTATTNEDTAADIYVLSNDTDIDQDPSLNANPSAEVLSIVTTDSGLKAPSHGSISVSGNKIVYTPTPNFNGTDTFEYNATDSQGAKDKGLVTVTINQVNDNPVAVTDSAITNEDTSVDVYPLTNDTDVDTNVSLNQGALNYTSEFSITSVSGTSHGSASFAGNKVTYTPAANYFGTDAITYAISDGHGGTANGTINVTINSVNDLPVFSTAPADMNLTEDGPDGASNFTVSDVETPGANLNVTVISSSNTTLAGTGDITITKGTDGDRTVTVNPKNDQNGSTVIKLRVVDTDGGTADYSFNISVTAVNDAPAAQDISGTINEDSSYTVSWTANSSDVDIATNGDSIHATIESGDGAHHGTAAVSGNNLIYTPTANWNGVDTFTYTVTDSQGAKDTGLVTVTVNQINDAPVAVDDTVSTNEDTALDIYPLSNDTDVDQDPSLNANPSTEALSASITDSGLKAPSHGSISLLGNKVTYTPFANYNGTDSFEYIVNDSHGAKDTGLVTVTIYQVNDNPVAVTDNLATNEDTAVDIYPLNNDTDIDTNVGLNQGALHYTSDFSLTSANGASHGSVSVVGNKVTYTPTANYFGSDTITYVISDGHGGSATGTINVTINSVNDLPVFSSTPADMHLAEDGADGSSGFTVSDVETAGTNLAVSVISSSNPALVGTSDISITKGTDGDRTVNVNPKDNQNGTTVIKLRVTDSDGGTADYSFNVSVAAVNDAPVAQDITGSVNEDSTYTVLWTDNSSDVDIATNGDTIGATIESGDGANHGTASVSGNSLIYTPAANWNGVDTFTYTVTDSQGAKDTGLVTVTVNQVNDPPVAGDDTAATNEDTPVDIYVLSNDTDIDKDVSLNAHPEAEALSISIGDSGLLQPQHGSISVSGDKIVYTPSANYNGTDSFEYNVNDGEAKDKGLVNVTINQVNDNPVAVTDSASTGNKDAVDIHVLDNDTDVDTDASLNHDVLHYKSTFSVASYGFVGGTNGTLSESGGVITYTPDLNFNGIQEITYTLSDGHGGTAIGLVYVHVGAQNAPPEAKDDSIETKEDTPVTSNIIDNDTDVDNGDVLSFVMFTEDTSGLPGDISADENGNLTFTPDANYHGSFTVGYEIKDASGATSTATVTITVTPVNDTPQALDDAVETSEDTPLPVDVSGLISDPDIATDSDVLTVTVEAAGAPKHGEYSVNGYSINYTPDANWNGTDTITYKVTDSHSASDTGVITITVDPVNDAPVAKSDSVTTNEDTPLEIYPLVNDTDVDTDSSLNAAPQSALTIDEGTMGTPSHGSVSLEGDKILYTPDPDYNGPDSFTYKATDGEYSSQATVSISVKQVNDDPVANDDTAQTTDGDMVTISVLDNDTDIDTLDANNCDVKYSLSDFSITAVSAPSNGTAVISGNKINYTAGATFAGIDTFTYTISDGHGGTATANVTVTVLSANDPPDIPVVSAPKEGDRYGGKSTINVAWSGSDIDGDALTYTLEYYDGAAWQIIASDMTDTTYDFAVPSTLPSITNLQFRVKAYDGEYYSSDYGYSGHVSVDKDVPMNVVVRMTTSDGKAYTAGTWTNMSVTVTAVSVTDASKVAFSYALESKAYADMPNETVTNGVHNAYIKAADEFGNAAEFGGYLIKIDKQDPAVPDTQTTVSGSNASVTFTPSDDPGSSGNRYIVLPDGSKKDVSNGGFTWNANKNGDYTFTIYDNAGNRTLFTVTINQLDETPPEITCDSGDYVTGQTSDKDITASLSFKDSESEIIEKGYAVDENKTFSGAYLSYKGEITLSDGEHYIHAFAKNAAGLTATQTFGPFIVSKAEPGPTPTEAPKGDVVVSVDDVTKGGKKIRLPGGEWTDKLVLQDVKPGTYIVEVMDENGNVSVTELTITDEEIAAGVYQPTRAGINSWYMWTGIGLLILLLMLFLLQYNVKVEICESGENEAKVIKTIRRLKRKKKEVTVEISGKAVRGSDFGNIILKKPFTKRMKGNTLIVTVDDSEVFNAVIPDDVNGSYEAKIETWEEQ